MDAAARISTPDVGWLNGPNVRPDTGPDEGPVVRLGGRFGRYVAETDAQVAAVMAETRELMFTPWAGAVGLLVRPRRRGAPYTLRFGVDEEREYVDEDRDLAALLARFRDELRKWRPGSAGMVRMGRDEERQELERIRAAAVSAVEGTSLREAARAVGMTPTGLHAFIDGSSPYEKTRVKLRRWYYARCARMPGGLSAVDARGLLLDLLRALPNPEDGLPELLESMARIYQTAGVPVPRWVGVLRGDAASLG